LTHSAAVYFLSAAQASTATTGLTTVALVALAVALAVALVVYNLLVVVVAGAVPVF
jgi:hypothetical protein